MTTQPLHINASRMLTSLRDLATIGATPDGGVSRPALSEADLAGRHWFEQRVNDSRLTFKKDGAGNLSAVLPTNNSDAPTVMIGSHLDTVPSAGRYDGALGVLAALEVLQTISESDIELPFNLEAISFTDEEGSVYSMLGSLALTGQLSRQELYDCLKMVELSVGLERLGLSLDTTLNAARPPNSIRAYLEVHIEQGTRLEDAQIDIGVVTSIVGIRRYWLHYHGQAAHAGTMPMDRRADALWGASDFVQRARKLVMEHFHPGVFNCSQVSIPNAAANIVPEQVSMSLEFRHGTEAMLDEMETTLLDLAQQTASDNRLTLTTERDTQVTPATMNEELIADIEFATSSLGLSHTRLLSYAGHDAQTMSTVAPSVMFFVPSRDGISHNPKEFTEDSDVINAGNVLLRAVLELAR